jgi:hypothetical protein
MNQDIVSSSNIILICLGLNTKKNEIKKVTISNLYLIFRTFGKIQKIIIFFKKKILKAFIEFNTLEASEKAKSFLHDNFIDDLGKIRIYFSKINNLEFSNEYLEYKDFQDNQDKLDLWNSEEFSYNSDQSQILFNHNKENDINLLNCIHFQQKQKNNHIKIISSSGSILKSEKVFSIFEKIAAPNQLNTKENDNFSHISSEKNKNNLRNNHIPSRVILISNLSPLFVNAREVFNFFKNYGNIKAIIFMPNLLKSLIEFEEFQNSTFCFHNLNSFKLLGYPLQITYSKYQEINENCSKSQKTECFNEILKVKNQDYLKKNKNFFTLPSYFLLAKIFLAKNTHYTTPLKLFANFEGLCKIDLISKKTNSCFFKLTFRSVDYAMKSLIKSQIEIKNLFKSKLYFYEI